MLTWECFPILYQGIYLLKLSPFRILMKDEHIFKISFVSHPCHFLNGSEVIVSLQAPKFKVYIEVPMVVNIANFIQRLTIEPLYFDLFLFLFV